MHIVQIYHARVPVSLYGGMERVVESLLEGFIELGHKVTLISYQGDYQIPGVNFIPLDRYKNMEEANERFVELIPKDADIVHFHLPLTFEKFPFPYICTMHGNMHPQEDKNALHDNVIFLCRDHAERHGKKNFVFNGLNPKNIPLNKTSLKERKYFSFLGRAGLKRKGLHLAKKIASRTSTKLKIGGGRGFGWFGQYEFLGHVNNQEKFALLGHSKALLFPILWQEPFGLVMIEAMFSGTPVFALKYGSVPEVLGQAGSEQLFLEANDLEQLMPLIEAYTYSASPTQIRSYAEQHFTHLKMCQGYLPFYHAAMGKMAL
ncbi:MAG: glycosyltransferase [Bacteriovoracaceae bacterium]